LEEWALSSCRRLVDVASTEPDWAEVAVSIAEITTVTFSDLVMTQKLEIETCWISSLLTVTTRAVTLRNDTDFSRRDSVGVGYSALLETVATNSAL
jgi:hypothetical protein